MHSFGLIDDKLVTQQKLYVKFNGQKVLAMFQQQNLVGISFIQSVVGKLD